MTPKIGLIANIANDLRVDAHGAYGRAVEMSGGVPLLLPYVEDEKIIDAFVELCDGFLFTGGVDVDPSYYGEEKKDTCGKTESNRDKLEMAVLGRALELGKPILGICRGLQIINVAMGGALYQDLSTEFEGELSHRQTEGESEPSHPILVEEGSPLYSVVGKKEMVGNSFHHQAIKSLADGLLVSARASDGIIEAVYAPDKKYLRAYQWHPERLYRFEDNKALFDDFINACK